MQNTELDYNSFEEIILNVLSSQAPLKKRMIRVNQKIFLNNEVEKAIMASFSLRITIFQEKIVLSREAYNKQRNYSIKLIKESKIKTSKNFTDYKTF